MSDYNDGKWHGWNGGECPVDPDYEVEPIWIDGRTARNRMAFRAGGISWGGDFDVPIAFRVTKPAPPKPRTMWGVGLHLHPTLETAREFLAALAADHPEMNFGPITEWTEVLPSTQTQGD